MATVMLHNIVAIVSQLQHGYTAFHPLPHLLMEGALKTEIQVLDLSISDVEFGVHYSNPSDLFLCC